MKNTSFLQTATYMLSKFKCAIITALIKTGQTSHIQFQI